MYLQLRIIDFLELKSNKLSHRETISRCNMSVSKPDYYWLLDWTAVRLVEISARFHEFSTAWLYCMRSWTDQLKEKGTESKVYIGLSYRPHQVNFRRCFKLTCASARWALMHYFLSVCSCGVAGPTLCTTATVQSYVVHHQPASL